MRRDEVESLYERFGPALLAYACSLLGRRLAAEDVLHQVFLSLLASGVARPENPKGSALEDSIALQAALVQLPAEQREVVVMHIWAELRFEEIAEITGVSANTAASRYRYGLKKLREQLSPQLSRNEVNEHASRK